MVIVKLQGGLGNQMFQYAAARSLTPGEESVYLDQEFFNNTTNTSRFTARDYQLSIFKKLKAFKVQHKDLELFILNSFRNKIARRLRRAVRVVQQENEFVSFSDLPSYRHIYLEGYFQSEKYFKHIEQRLRREFEFPDLDSKNACIKKQILHAENPVSIHIRRGDYLKPLFSEVLGILPLQYYHKALDTLDREVQKKTMFIFSDDIQWAKQNFRRENAQLCFIDNNSGGNSWKDMDLMSACKHHIIANSSFSWWSAWLSNDQGKVFAPCNWFNSLKVKFNIHDFIPPHWSVIEYE